MPRCPTGNAVRHGDKWYARIAVGPKTRKAVHLEVCGPDDEDKARERATLMAKVVARLRKAKRDDFIPAALKKLATLSGAALTTFVKLAEGYADGTYVRGTTTGSETTFGTFAK